MTVVFSCTHSNDFPMGVGKRKVCGGVDSFTFRFGRSICSNKGFDDEYDSSTWFTYHRSPPKRKVHQDMLTRNVRRRHSPGVLVKYIESTNPWNVRVTDESSELSQIPESGGFLRKDESSWEILNVHLLVRDSRASKRQLPCLRSTYHDTECWEVHQF